MTRLAPSTVSMRMGSQLNWRRSEILCWNDGNSHGIKELNREDECFWTCYM